MVQAIQVHDSALKCGLSADDVRELWMWAVDEIDLDGDDPGRVARISCDEAGRWYELIAVGFDGRTRWLVIHVMRLRKSTRELFRRAR